MNGIQLSRNAPILRIKEENRQRVLPLHLFPHLKGFLQPYFERIFLIFSIAAEIESPTAETEQPSISAIRL